jgi:hypothetical protein
MMKIKPVIIATLLFACSIIYASDSTSFKRLYVGVSFTPAASYRLLADNPSVAASNPSQYATKSERDDMIKFRNKIEKPDFGFNVGLRVGVNVTSFFSIETGFEYARKVYRYEIDSLSLGYQWNGSTYTATESAKFKVYENYRYLDIPVALNFSIGKKRLKGIISTGSYFEILLDKTNTGVLRVDGGKSERNTRFDNSPFNTFNISPFLGAGVDYRINGMMHVRVMPIAQMQALKNIDTAITEYLWSAGINASLYFGFIPVK